LIQRFPFQHNDGTAVVPVQMPALSRVVEKPVAVTEIDFLGYAEHRTASPDSQAWDFRAASHSRS
jgi:hypothetical protein